MNATDILNAVQQAAAALRVEGDSLVASNASRLAPELKAAIRQNKPQLITALAGPVCAVCGARGDLWHLGDALVHQECAHLLPKPESVEPSAAYLGVTTEPDGNGCKVTIVEIPATGLRYCSPAIEPPRLGRRRPLAAMRRRRKPVSGQVGRTGPSIELVERGPVRPRARPG